MRIRRTRAEIDEFVSYSDGSGNVAVFASGEIRFVSGVCGSCLPQILAKQYGTPNVAKIILKYCRFLSVYI